MHAFPPDVTGELDVIAARRRSPAGFLLWMMRRQAGVLVAMTVATLVAFLPQALAPYFLGRAIDAGVVHGDWSQTLVWAAAMTAAMVIATVAGVLEHTFEVSTWLSAAFRTQKLAVRQAARLGYVHARRVPTGEALSVSASDSQTFGMVMEVTGRTLGAVMAFGFVAAIVLATSPLLGVAVLIAVPFALLVAAPLMIPLERASDVERTRESALTDLATDIVSGLRILRGVGGEGTFSRNFDVQSRSLQRAGIVAGTWHAATEAVSVALAGLLLALLSWLGANELLAGRLTIGQMISFFGYAVFLVWPIKTVFEFAQRWIAGLVAARRTVDYLLATPPRTQPTEPVQFPDWAELFDRSSGVVIRPGEFTCIVCEASEDAQSLADRLGYYLPPGPSPAEADEQSTSSRRARRKLRAVRAAHHDEVRRAERAAFAGIWGVQANGTDYSQILLTDIRQAVAVMDAGTQLFSGTLQQFIDPWQRMSRQRAEAALRTAAAEDVLLGLPGGWQGIVDERGRGLSGGQRQRLALARAVAADPQVLVLVEPTSAVDAHTESRIAARLIDRRRGRTTVALTGSPLVLRAADRVVFVSDGVARDSGGHADLMRRSDEYRVTVSRGMAEEASHD